ncbi:MAG: FHA domain-containing protein [Synechococcus sp.]
MLNHPKHQACLCGSNAEVVKALTETEKIVIGRALDCQIIFDAPQEDVSVSRHHAEVRPLAESEDWEICDLNSANGTFVNGQQLHGCLRLTPGDRLTFGQSPRELVFEVQTLPAIETGTEVSSPGQKGPLSRPTNHHRSILSPGSWFPPLRSPIQSSDSKPRSSWQELWEKGRFSSVFIYLILCLIAVSVSDRGISNALFTGCLLSIAIATISRLCGKYKPWWLILGLASITAGLTVVGHDLLPDILAVKNGISIVRQLIKAPTKEIIKALPVLSIYSMGRMLPRALQKRIRIVDPLDGVLLTIASAIGLVVVESYHKDLALIIAGILPNTAGDLAYSGVFGYYIGLSAMKSPRHRWKIIGFGFLLTSVLHFVLNLRFFPVEIRILLSILEYSLLITCILKGIDEAEKMRA